VPTGQRSTTPALHQQIWDAATNYIEVNVAAPLTLDLVARAAFTSRRQLQRVFALEGRTNVRAYVTIARMERARALVVDSAEPLAAIAAAVGFADQAHFSRTFRARLGRPPSRWPSPSRADPAPPTG
jgi:AraC family transcriptional regulator